MSERDVAGPVHLVSAENHMRLSRIPLPGDGGTEWHWCVGVQRGRELITGTVRRFSIEEKMTDPMPEPIRRGSLRRRTPESRCGTVRLANGVTVNPTGTTSGDEPRYAIVRFHGPIRAEWKDALETYGGRPIEYLPDDAFIVRVTPGSFSSLSESPGVDWVAPWEARFKIQAGSDRPGKDAGNVELVLLLFPGEKISRVKREIREIGGEVLESSSNILRVRIDAALIDRVGGMEEVRSVEPFRLFRTMNEDCQWVTQSGSYGTRPLWDHGLNGDGILLAVCDSGILPSHDMFTDPLYPITGFGDYPGHRKIAAYWKADSTSAIVYGDHQGAYYHGCHTICTAAGNDSSHGSSDMDGSAPGARVFCIDGGGNSTSIYTPLDLGDLFEAVYNGNGAGAPRIMYNSWGLLGGGAYDYRCEQVDRFLWDHKDFLLLFSNGNGGIANSVSTPAVSKNCVSVGGTENGVSSGELYTSGSRGPTDDGRLKPTLCAPARLYSASGESDGSFQTLEGTSMATPAVAGGAALVMQYFLEGYYPTGLRGASPPLVPSAALLKAVLVNGSEDDIDGCTIPSNDAGWGRLNLDEALYFPGDGKRLAIVDETAGILTGETVSYEVTVASSGEPLEVVLVWTDYPSTPAASTNLVNDLDLTVTGGGNSYKGNVFSGGFSINGGERDSLNVEECVLVNGPATGVWTIEVTGGAVPFGPQPYAIVVTADLDANIASVVLDRGSYGGADTLFVRVEDANAASPVTVTVWSDTETEPESLLLTGSGGVFEGTIVTTTGWPNEGDGLLSLCHGDSIRVAYTDEAPPAERTAGAAAWLTGPVLYPITVPETGEGEAVIRWETDIPSDSRLYYGLEPGALADTLSSPDLVTLHEISLVSLLPDTTYYLRISSADFRGNRTEDGGGSEPYRVTTGDRADVLIVIGDITFEKTDSYRYALDRFGWNGRIVTGTLPAVGDLTHGLRSYPAVWWQAGWEEYPPFPSVARETISRYIAGGGRISVVSHDVAWAFGDTSSGFWSQDAEDWLHDALKIEFKSERSYWSIDFGVSGDPISGSYTYGISYDPFRSEGAGDEIGAVSYNGSVDSVWSNNYGPALIGTRWADWAISGSPDSAVWGGLKSRGVTSCFEWSQLNESNEDDYQRARIFDQTLRWLITRDHPDVTLSTFKSGGSVSAAPVAIEWSESVYGGTGVAGRKIDWSGDGGASWNRITDSAGPSPYYWNLDGVPNGTTVRVRVTVYDDGAGGLSGRDASVADISITIPGNDTRGPRVIAGSPSITPNPAPKPGDAVLTALFSDSTRGGSDIDGAEWSLGPADAGDGIPMSGAWDAISLTAICTLDVGGLTAPFDTIWIRGRDAEGAWGEAYPFPVTLRGEATDVALSDDAPPAAFRLHANRPNPFNPETTIRFDLPSPEHVRLNIYNINGRLVRTLADERFPTGYHQTVWDGADSGGRPAASGVYFFRIETGNRTSTRKMVLIR